MTNDAIEQPPARRASGLGPLVGAFVALTGAQALSAVLGDQAGWAMYRSAEAASRGTTDNWASLGWALQGLIAGVLVAFVTFPMLFMLLLRVLAPGVRRAKAVLAAILTSVVSLVLFKVAGAIVLAIPGFDAVPAWTFPFIVEDIPVVAIVLWIAAGSVTGGNSDAHGEFGGVPDGNE